MGKASRKDILRTIKKERKRFFSIMTITILGVTMMTGLRAGCEDLRVSADRFYDEGNLFDITIQSTLGLTDEDIDAVGSMEGILQAEGTYTEVVRTKKGNIYKTAEMKVIRKAGINLPFVVEGRLPEKKEEIAVTSSYLKDTGKAIGDTVSIEEIMEETEGSLEEELSFEEEKIEEDKEVPNFIQTKFTITGTVIDVTDINNADGSAGFRATPNADYTFFIVPDAVDIEVYSSVNLVLQGTKELMCYTKEYEEMTAHMVEEIEEKIMEQRKQARYLEVKQEAYHKINEKEEEMREELQEAEDKLDEADLELIDAKRKIDDGWKEVYDGWEELEKEEVKASQEIEDARKELSDAYEQLNDGWIQLNEGEKELHLAKEQLEEGRQLLVEKENEAHDQFEQAEVKIKEKIQENEINKKQLKEGIDQIKEAILMAYQNNGQQTDTAFSPEIEQAWEEYTYLTKHIAAKTISSLTASGESDQGVIQSKIREAIDDAAANNSEYRMASGNLSVLLSNDPIIGSGILPGIDSGKMMELASNEAILSATGDVLHQSYDVFLAEKESALRQLAGAWEEIYAGEKELQGGWEKISSGREEIIGNYEKYKDGVKELEENEAKASLEFADARKKLKNAEMDLKEGEKELKEGRKELEEAKEEYQTEKKKAEEKLAEAKEEINDLDMTQWYVQDRTSLSGYSNVQSDTDSIESLAGVFAVVFFVVAILISLTSVTRMVEEERGLIGTYKALGFYDGEIEKKYLVYTMAASGVGAVLGDVGGFIVLPEILFVFFRVMYLFPEYFLQFDVLWGILPGILFILGIAGAAFIACYTEVKHWPAELMRPKSPRAGTRVILERITPLWKRMSFLNKVTARNIFRYKKRMFMTLFGIAGCTALLVFGLSIKDSVSELMPLQYENIYSYDLLAAAGEEDLEKLTDYVSNCEEIDRFMELRIESVKLKNQENDTEKVQLMVVEDEKEFYQYVTLMDQDDQIMGSLKDGMYVTENAAKILGLSVSDKARVQRMDLVEKEIEMVGLVKNYLGNNLYMTKDTYQKFFGDYEANGILANFNDTFGNHMNFADELAKEDWILSSISTEELKDEFSAAFTLINLVVYVVLILAAGLAFVVLFTLATINISERERELATIKVLGFYEREVYSYVNKETMILTVLGILIGLPAGAVLSGMLTDILSLPSIYFAVTIYPRSYMICSAIALFFALIVQFLTNKSLDHINPVEALKSVE